MQFNLLLTHYWLPLIFENKREKVKIRFFSLVQNKMPNTAFILSILNLQFSPFILNGLSYLNCLDMSISNRRGVWVVFIIAMFNEISVLNTNSVDPDQTPRSVGSDLGPRYSPMSLFMGC